MSNPLSSLINWVKANKLSSSLFAIVAYVLIRSLVNGTGPIPLPAGMMSTAPAYPNVNNVSTDMERSVKMMNYAADSIANGPVGAGRMTTQTTSLALKVKDVKGVAGQIETLAKTQDGWLVDSTLAAADTGSTNGSISIRVPTPKLAETLSQIRSLGLRVVTEHVVGTDITDQYQNVTEQLKILEQTKQKLESILASATRVQDMLEAQRELLNMQQQIDSLQGQQKYLDQSAQLSLVTVYLATDELALPLNTPGEAWRPNLVFKEAVRALIGFGYRLGNLGIWLVVFAPVWLPLLLGYKWWQKQRLNR